MYVGKGRCACAGVTYGKAVHVKTPKPSLTSEKDSYLSVEEELELFENGLTKAKQELEALNTKVEAELGTDYAQIIEIHRMMLDDPDIADNIRERIKSGAISACQASIEVGIEQARDFETLDDPYMKERASDVKDVTERIVRCIRGSSTIELTEPSIIVADDLLPSQTVSLDRSKILGFVLRKGTLNSHASILARTMNIPLIINANLPISLEDDSINKQEAESKAAYQASKNANAGHAFGHMLVKRHVEKDVADLTGHTIGLNAEQGIFFIDPDEETIAQLQHQKDVFDTKRMRQLALRGLPGISPCGHRVYTFANIGQPDDVELVLENDGEGIGLFRSEFIYLGRDAAPQEEEQFNAYAKVASTMNGRLVVIRTLDIGADKQAPYFKLPKEENPAMGMRALRICLTRPELFKIQLRAIYRAAARGNVAMMFPMVTRLSEIESAKAICAEVEADLTKEGIPFKVPKIGVMIETPAAAILSEELAKHVDFFSVGTNDLTQYTTACDRQNHDLGVFYDPHHEAVLELLRIIAVNAHKAGIPCGICGELASDPELTDLFIEMGYDELSVSPGAVLSLRERIRESKAVCKNPLVNPKIKLDAQK